MPCQMLLAADFLQWGAWIIPVAGLGCAGLTLLMGKRFFGAGTKPVSAPAIQQQPQPTGDPFDNGSADERRQAFRRGNRLTKVIVSAPAIPEPFIGWVTDRSVRGLGLLVDRKIPRGAILSLRTTNAADDTQAVEIRVQWCRSEDGQWEAGCTFVRSPAWSTLMLFG
jgi:hypothetical protein